MMRGGLSRRLVGLDPIHLGAMVVINFAIGMATPPLGYSLFVGATVARLPVESVASALWPMLAVKIVVPGFDTFVPAVMHYLPSLIR